jgi:hypothetical protein
MPEFQSFWQFAGWFALAVVAAMGLAFWQPVNVNTRIGDEHYGDGE